MGITKPVPSAEPITGMEMVTTGYMMSTASAMMAAAILAKGTIYSTVYSSKRVDHAVFRISPWSTYPQKRKETSTYLHLS